uniref:Vacuolar protein sorting-associated protein 2 homolog 1-like n=1 Tax=Rhizophora mucronata TaxID=61149 RepID=A0A2P2KEH9_RHIMU
MRSFAIIFTAPICPCLAFFFISVISFFSCACRPCLSLSISLIDLSSILLFSRRSSAGVFLLPNRKLMLAVTEKLISNSDPPRFGTKLRNPELNLIRPGCVSV